MLTNYAVHICDFHIFPVIIHHLEGLFGSIIMTAPSWLVAQLVDQYHRDHGFKSHTGLNFFFSGFISTTSSVVFVAIRIAHISFLLAVHIYDFHIFPVIIYHLEGLFRSSIMTSSQLAC